MYERVYTYSRAQQRPQEIPFLTHVISEIIDRRHEYPTYIVRRHRIIVCTGLYKFFFFQNFHGPLLYIHIYITLLLPLFALYAGTTTTCERHRSSVNKMTCETGPVKFSTAPSPNLIRDAYIPPI